MMTLEVNNYVKVKSLQEAYELLLADDSNQIIGGGAWLKMATKPVNTLIDLELLKLDDIVVKQNIITIGANVTLRDLEKNKDIKEQFSGILYEAVHQVMGVGVRNLATIGGSIMGKFSFSDILTPLLTMDVSLEFYKQGIISLQDFLATKKPPKDILLHIILKQEKGNGFFKKVRKTALDFAVVNICVVHKDSGFEIVIGARPGIAVKASKAMTFLNRQSSFSEQVIQSAVALVQEEISFSKNLRASKEYREQLVAVYVARGIKEVTQS